MAAREGEHTWKALYHEVKATPSAANLRRENREVRRGAINAQRSRLAGYADRSRFGVLIVPLSPAKPDRSETADGCE